MEGEVPGSLSTKRLFKRTRCTELPPRPSPNVQNPGHGRPHAGRTGSSRNPHSVWGQPLWEGQGSYKTTHSHPAIQPPCSAVLTQRTQTLRFTQKPARGCWQQLRSQCQKPPDVLPWADRSIHGAHPDKEHAERRGRDDTEETQMPVTKRRRPARRRRTGRLPLRGARERQRVGPVPRPAMARAWGRHTGRAPAFRATELLCLMRSWWIQDIT